MTAYTISKNADEDLQDIYWFTHERWGEQQAEFYINGLFSTFDKLAQFPEMGRLRAELSAKIRSFAHKRHVIFYVSMERQVGISRVLHGAVDTGNAGFFDE
jgi:toxin ParE1/3/4